MKGNIFIVYVTEHRIDVIDKLLSAQFLSRLEKKK